MTSFFFFLIFFLFDLTSVLCEYLFWYFLNFYLIKKKNQLSTSSQIKAVTDYLKVP